MLLSLVDVLGCENPQCREFAQHPIPAHGARTYYCPVCGRISYSRAVDAALAASPVRYEAYLRRLISEDKSLVSA